MSAGGAKIKPAIRNNLSRIDLKHWTVGLRTIAASTSYVAQSRLRLKSIAARLREPFSTDELHYLGAMLTDSLSSMILIDLDVTSENEFEPEYSHPIRSAL